MNGGSGDIQHIQEVRVAVKVSQPMNLKIFMCTTAANCAGCFSASGGEVFEAVE